MLSAEQMILKELTQPWHFKVSNSALLPIVIDKFIQIMWLRVAIDNYLSAFAFR